MLNMRGWRLGCCVLAAIATWQVPARAEIVDRILAVVDRELITLSDVSAALRLGLVPATPQGADAVRGALDALIARQLELREANRYQPPEPTPAQVEARLDAVRARFSAPSDFERILVLTGLSDDQLRLRLREDMRIEAYLGQRFGAARPPSAQEMAEYYRTHQAEFTTPAGIRSFEEVREEVRTRLGAIERAALISDWLESLRKRTQIADLYVAGK